MKKVLAYISLPLAATLIVGSFFIFQSHKKAVSGPIETIDAPAETSTDASPATTPESPQGDKAPTNGQNSSTGSLTAPYGSLVSNHKPGQNGSDLKEMSQCITSVGARCYIKLTQGNVVKTLPAKIAGSDGTIFWEWNVEDAGLIGGKWTVTAVATLGNQTKSTTDQILLEVQ